MIFLIKFNSLLHLISNVVLARSYRYLDLKIYDPNEIRVIVQTRVWGIKIVWHCINHVYMS